MQDVVCVDLRDWEAGDPTRREAFARTLREGLLDSGFVRVVGHEVTPTLVERAHRCFAAFFALPESQKKACATHASGQRGHTPLGVEHARDHPVADLKEFYHVGQPHPPEGADAGDYPPNVWPESPAELRGVALELYASLERAAMRLLEAIAEAFGLPRPTFASMVEGGNSILRALHYPPVPAGADPRALRAAPHEDVNLITLLCEATDPGLEILGPDGSWSPVVSGPGEIIADAGDMLARATNGAIPATTHRVVAGPGSASGHRYALPFFAHPRPECDLSVLPAFVADGEAPLFPPITAGAFLEERLREIGLIP